jgi:hypothetical protein
MLLVAFTGVVCWSSGTGTLDRHMWDVEPSKYPTVALVRLDLLAATEAILTNRRVPGLANSSSLLELV